MTVQKCVKYHDINTVMEYLVQLSIFSFVRQRAVELLAVK